MTTTFPRMLSLIARPLVLLVGDLLHPIDDLPVELFLDGDVRHGRGGRCAMPMLDRKSTRLNSSHSQISYAVFCLKKKKNQVTKDHQCDERGDRTYMALM